MATARRCRVCKEPPTTRDPSRRRRTAAALIYCSHDASRISVLPGVPHGARATGDHGGKPRLACPECEFVHWRNPLPVVGAIVERAGRVVLVHGLGRPPTWYGLVAGFLETGETPQECALREVEEELGIDGPARRIRRGLPVRAAESDHLRLSRARLRTAQFGSRRTSWTTTRKFGSRSSSRGRKARARPARLAREPRLPAADAGLRHAAGSIPAARAP